MAKFANVVTTLNISIVMNSSIELFIIAKLEATSIFKRMDVHFVCRVPYVLARIPQSKFVKEILALAHFSEIL